MKWSTIAELACFTIAIIMFIVYAIRNYNHKNEYIIVKGVFIHQITMLVSEKLNDGWECVGGIFVHWTGESFMYYQAMKK